MGSLIKKYAKGTPKPFAVAVKKKAATEQEASMMIVASGDRKATASPTKEGKYVVRYRKWFDTSEAAQAFVDTASAKSQAKSVVADNQTLEDKAPSNSKTAAEVADFPLKDLKRFVEEDLGKMEKTCQSLVRLSRNGHYGEVVNQLKHLVDTFIPVILKTIDKVNEAAAGEADDKKASVEPSVSPEKVAEIKNGLEKLATFCTQRELKDLAAKTKSVLDLI